MGKLQAMHRCIAFTVISMLACHMVLSTHARQITSMKHFKPKTETTERNQNTQTSSGKKKVDEYTFDVAASSDLGPNAFRHTTPGGSPGVGHREFEGDDNDVKAKVAVHTPDEHIYDVSASSNSSTNAFRHTTPGSSPGGGHREFAGDNNDVKAKVAVHSSDEHTYNVSSDSDTNAFRHTTPGSSPGVGHQEFAGDVTDVKAKVVVHNPDVPKDYYVTEGSTDDFKGPGHSPGVGHVLGNKN